MSTLAAMCRASATQGISTRHHVPTNPCSKRVRNRTWVTRFITSLIRSEVIHKQQSSTQVAESPEFPTCHFVSVAKPHSAHSSWAKLEQGPTPKHPSPNDELSKRKLKKKPQRCNFTATSLGMFLASFFWSRHKVCCAMTQLP